MASLEQRGVLGGVKVGIYASNKKYLDVLYVFSFNLLMQILLMVYGNLELASDSDICSYLWLAMLFQREKKSISFGGANMPTNFTEVSKRTKPSPGGSSHNKSNQAICRKIGKYLYSVPF